VKKKVLKNTFMVVFLLASSVVWGSDKCDTSLKDGFFVNGVDGKVAGPDSNGVYKFIADSGLSDGKAVIKAGTAVELLYSTTLSKIIENLPREVGEPNSGIRLWGRITAYRGKNYIFPIYFLPFQQVDKQKQTEGRQTLLTVNEPNDPLSIPPEVLEKLTSGKVIEPVQIRKGLELKEDHILADRTGYIVKQSDGRYAFVFDALGRNVDKTVIILLPCQALEKALSEQKNAPEAVRLKAAGIVTKYQDNFYLLLQRTSRVYSNGNFPK
jgi:hypothetical protein